MLFLAKFYFALVCNTLFWFFVINFLKFDLVRFVVPCFLFMSIVTTPFALEGLCLNKDVFKQSGLNMNHFSVPYVLNISAIFFFLINVYIRAPFCTRIHICVF